MLSGSTRHKRETLNGSTYKVPRVMRFRDTESRVGAPGAGEGFGGCLMEIVSVLQARKREVDSGDCTMWMH